MRERSQSPPRGLKRERSPGTSPQQERRGFDAPGASLSGLPAIALPGAEGTAAAPLSAPSGAAPGGLPAPPPAPSLLAAAPPATASAIAAALAGGLGGVGAGAMTSAQQAAARKAREIYLGNLASDRVTPEIIRELFDTALMGYCDNPATQKPVVEVKMDPAVRFTFVEFATEEMATAALTLDRTDLFGKSMKIARPSGYQGPQTTAAPVGDKLLYAQQMAAKIACGGTNVVLLEGLVDAATIRDESERQEVTEMVYEEALRCGKVKGIAVPLPPLDIPATTPCRVYVKYEGSGEAARCVDMMNGRQFDDHAIKADFVTEVEYKRSNNGEWFTGVIPDERQAALAGGGAAAPGSSSLTGLPTIQL